MKRLVTVLVGVFLVSMLLLPSVAVEARPRLVSQENPSTAQSSLDSYSFLTQYTQIFDLISSEQYTNASKLAQELSLISPSAALSYIVNRYSNLTQQFINVLSQLQTTLDNASSLLSQNRLEEAAVNLNKADVLIAEAEILLSELQAATTTLTQQLGALAAPAQSKAAEAYNSLQSALQKLSALVNEYDALLQNTKNQEQTSVKQLQATALTLNLSSTSVFVGGTLSASGILSSSGQALPSRSVSLLLSGAPVATALTNSTGSFETVITVPPSYVKAMTVQAIYTPTGNDSNVYSAALSPAATVKVNFYLTDLNMSAPAIAFPDLPLIINGSVSSQSGSPLESRSVEFQFGNATIRTQSTLNGSFYFQTIVNSSIPLGSYNLTVSVEPKGVYAGVSKQETLSVQQYCSTVKVQAPSIVLLPSGIQVKGTVYSAMGQPLSNANVTVSFDARTATTQTLNDGSFKLEVNAPLTDGFAGLQDLNITVQPQEPWQTQAIVQSSVFVLNIIGVSVASASFMSVGFVTYSAFSKSKTKRKVGNAASESSVDVSYAEPTVHGSAKEPEYKFEGVKGKVLETYAKALRSVESATGASLKLYMTLREFLQSSEQQLGVAGSQFAKLTALAESALYSQRAFDDSDLSNAEELLEKIEEALGK